MPTTVPKVTPTVPPVTFMDGESNGLWRYPQVFSTSSASAGWIIAESINSSLGPHRAFPGHGVVAVRRRIQECIADNRECPTATDASIHISYHRVIGYVNGKLDAPSVSRAA